MTHNINRMVLSFQINNIPKRICKLKTNDNTISVVPSVWSQGLGSTPHHVLFIYLWILWPCDEINNDYKTDDLSQAYLRYQHEVVTVLSGCWSRWRSARRSSGLLLVVFHMIGEETRGPDPPLPCHLSFLWVWSGRRGNNLSTPSCPPLRFVFNKLPKGGHNEGETSYFAVNLQILESNVNSPPGSLFHFLIR